MYCFGEDNANELSTTGEKQISLDGFSISGFQVVKSERLFEDVNGSFNENAVLVEIIPVFGVSRNTRAITKALIGIGIHAFSVRGIGTGRITGADSCVAFLNRFRADPLAARGTVLTAGITEESKLFTCQRTNGIAELIEILIGSLRVSRVKRDARSGEVKNIFQERIVVIGIKGGVA